MEFSVYILANEKGNFYIGQTNDLERRLVQHNDVEKSSWAAQRGPWRMIYTEAFDSRAEAMKKEKALKSLKNKDKIKAYIEGAR